jgi:hypothetical protein
MYDGEKAFSNQAKAENFKKNNTCLNENCNSSQYVYEKHKKANKRCLKTCRKRKYKKAICKCV